MNRMTFDLKLFFGKDEYYQFFQISDGTKNNMVKISINKGWSMNGKLAVIGLIASIAIIIAVVLLN